jgi:hypothetical protein
MARDAAITYEIDNNGNAVPESSDADQEKSYDEFRADSTGTDGGMKAWVYRCPENQTDGGVKQNASMEMLMCEPVDRFTLDEIMAIVRRDFMGTNELRWIIRIMIRDGRTLKLNKVYAVRKARENPDNVPASKKSEFAELMEQNRRMMADFMRVMSEREQRAPASAPDSISPMQMIQFMMGQQNESMKTVALLISAMKPDATKSGTSDVMTMLEGMSRVQDFARNMNPTSGDGSGSAVDIIKAASPFAPVLAAIIAKAGGSSNGSAQSVQTPLLANPTPAPAPPVVPAAPASVPQSASETVIEESPQVNIAQLRDQLGKLADIAGQNPPPPAADVVSNLMPEIPEDLDALIVDTLSGEDWFTKMCFIQPKIRDHRAWFEDVRREMLSCYSDDKPAEIAAPVNHK